MKRRSAPVGCVTQLSASLGAGIGPEDKLAYIAKLKISTGRGPMDSRLEQINRVVKG